jgi:hypothetical protein
MIIEFLIQGSLTEPYKVTFQKNNDWVYAACNCRERTSGKCCKHIMNILDGDITKMVTGGYSDVEKVSQLISGTSFSKIYNEYKAGLKIFNSKTLTELRRSLVRKPMI